MEKFNNNIDIVKRNSYKIGFIDAVNQIDNLSDNENTKKLCEILKRWIGSKS